jgi:hypothetical protein
VRTGGGVRLGCSRTSSGGHGRAAVGRVATGVGIGKIFYFQRIKHFMWPSLIKPPKITRFLAGRKISAAQLDKAIENSTIFGDRYFRWFYAVVFGGL